MKKLLLIMGLVVAMAFGATGCYSRVELPVKSTPASTRIFIDFDVDQNVAESMAANAANVGNTNMDSPEEATAYLNTVVVQVRSVLKADLVKRRIGFPVLDPQEQAELRLTGTMRLDPMSGPVLDWQLVEAASNTVILAGVASSMFLNAEQLADQVLAEVLSLDVDRYANGGGPSVGPAPAPVGPLTPPGSGTDGARSFAVIVGIERYRDALPEASHAESDARAFADFAQKTLGVPPEHIRLLLGDRAGRADIASAVEEWLPRNAVEPGSTVYFFFSGHGAPDVETGDAYLVPYDADPAFLKTRGYSLAQIYKSLGALPQAQSFAFIDACFSGAGDRSVLAAGTRPLVPVKDVAPQGRGVIALSASAARETTGAASKAAHGLFTFHLLGALSGLADANQDRNVTLDEVVSHVTREVTREARLQNRDQTPSLSAPAGVKPEAVVLVRALTP